MKRLFVIALAAMCMCMALSVAAYAEDSYWVAVGKIDNAKIADPAMQSLMTAHIEYLGQLYDAGNLVMAGPFGVGDEGMLLLKAASKEEAMALLHADPSIAGGLIEPLFVRPWQAFFSRPDNRRFTAAEFAQMMASGQSPESGMAAGDDMGAIEGDAEAAEGSEFMPELGSPMFMQVPTTDKASSIAFYSTLFGWQIEDDPANNMTFFTAPGNMMGEFTDMNKPAAPQSGVVFYITTDSVKAMVPRVEAAGGRVVMPSMKLPENWGYIAVVTDPSGNAVGLWSVGE